jgi:hypothetical protein
MSAPTSSVSRAMRCAFSNRRDPGGRGVHQPVHCTDCENTPQELPTVGKCLSARQKPRPLILAVRIRVILKAGVKARSSAQEL